MGLMLDSGAFSAKNKGTTIDIHKYIAFIKKHSDIFEYYITLDVIGNGEASYNNLKIMEDNGLRPIPVYHYGTDMKWLFKYLDQGYDYIALGGLVRKPGLVNWLDILWTDHLTDDNNYPIVKIHGFGLTDFKLLFRYPWYSLDSGTWMMCGAMGRIIIPYRVNGIWTYDRSPYKVSVTYRKDKASHTKRHIWAASPRERQRILDYLKHMDFKLGLSDVKQENRETYELKEDERWIDPYDLKNQTVEIILEHGVCNDYKLRHKINLKYFMDLAKYTKPYPYKFEHPVIKKGGLF